MQYQRVMKAFVLILLILILNPLEIIWASSCLRYYQPSSNNTVQSLGQAEAVYYDVQALSNMSNSHFSLMDSLYRIFSGFSIMRLRLDRNLHRLPETIDNQNYRYTLGDGKHVPTNFITFRRDQSLKELYDNYRGQGPERSDHLKTYQNEDHLAEGRTTHFLLQDGDVTMGRIQLQHSLSPSEPLNVESHFAEAPRLINRKPGELVYEMGRLFIPESTDQFSPLTDKFKRKLAFYELFLRALIFAHRTVPADKLVFQTNESVLDIIRHRFKPMKVQDASQLAKPAYLEYDLFLDKKNVFDVTQPGQVAEKLTILDKIHIAKFTRIAFKKRLEIILESFLKYGHSELQLTIHPDEKFLYDEVDIVSLASEAASRVYGPHFTRAVLNSLPFSIRHPSVPIQTSLNFDPKNYINPHLISLGKEEAQKLLERIQQ